jgi:hypothetical protein
MGQSRLTFNMNEGQEIGGGPFSIVITGELTTTFVFNQQ